MDTVASARISQTPETVIRARSGWIAIDWPELLRFRDLLFFLVWRDYKNREADLGKKGRLTSLRGIPVPHEKRTKGLVVALAIGVIAACMEVYQLATQYLASGR